MFLKPDTDKECNIGEGRNYRNKNLIWINKYLSPQLYWPKIACWYFTTLNQYLLFLIPDTEKEYGFGVGRNHYIHRI